MSVGRRQYTKQGESQRLSVRLLDENQEPLDLDALPSHTITVFSNGKSELIPETTTGLAIDLVDPSVLHYTRTWDESTFSRKSGYNAEFKLFSGGGAFTRSIRFDVVRRIFRSQLSDQEVFDLYPFIEKQLSTGETLAAFREQAWKDIENTIRQRWGSIVGEKGLQYSFEGPYDSTIYPGDVFYPEDFFDAHLELTAGFFFRGNAFSSSPTSEDWARYQDSMERGRIYLDNALKNVALDLDKDGQIDEREKNLYIGVEIVR